MTADVGLLPLPEWMRNYTIPTDGFECGKDVMLVDRMHDYARANVARAAAPLQAEVEALRAEVSGLRAARIAYANEFPATEDGDPDTGNIHANIRALKARADRLTEALRELVDLKDNVKHSFPNDYAVRKPLAWDKARALLRELEEGKCWT